MDPDDLERLVVAIRKVLQEFVASGETLTLEAQQATLRVGDLALTSTRLADGGVTVEVARRQPDGAWRWVIDRWNVLDARSRSDDDAVRSNPRATAVRRGADPG